MCKKLIFLVSLVLVLALAANASALSWWSNTSNDSHWTTAANWNFGGGPVPGSADTGSTYQVQPAAGGYMLIDSSDGTVQIEAFRLNNNQAGRASLVIEGTGSLQVLGTRSGVDLALSPNNLITVGGATIIMRDTANLTSNLVRLHEWGPEPSNSHIIMYDNTTFDVHMKIRISPNTRPENGTGFLILYDEAVCRFADMGMSLNGIIDIRTLLGAIYVQDDRAGTKKGVIDGYVANGWINGFGNNYNVVTQLIADAGFSTGWATKITAVPEPATIMLLGLGGLALLRRKR